MPTQDVNPVTIRNARLSSGLTQKEFARRIGVDTITVSRWERGQSLPNSMLVRRTLSRFISLSISSQKGTTDGD
ncbi:hypothetical protein LCGC14_1686150 [marine sediment metagenome]|uniref:HTH cro/C1-type domain-containing protein n=1 Tax=marine sediment metagenome TaxID=412755 RepID=A0A0F9KM87_9ZZZZ